MLTAWEASSVDRPDESLRNPKRTLQGSGACMPLEARVEGAVVRTRRMPERG